MSWKVYTTQGILMSEGPGGSKFASDLDSQADANERNKRAEGLGIETRYEAKESK